MSSLEGTLELSKLPDVLQLVAQHRKTGILTVQGQQDIIAVSFLQGQIVAADALNQTVEEGLGQVLVAEGLMAAPDFARAASDYPASGQRLLDYLVERRLVARPELLRALRIQTARLLEQLLRWTQGEFKFYSGDEVSYEEGLTPIPVDELLYQAAQKNPTIAPGPRPVPASVAARPASPAAAFPPPAAPPPSAGLDETGGAPPDLRVVRREGAPVVPDLAEGERVGAFRKMKIEAQAAPSEQPLIPSLLASGFILLLAFAVLFRSEAALLPFPWQATEREALGEDLRTSLYLKVDQAAKTGYLLDGHFPASLADLVTAGLLGRADLRDPRGRPLRYEPGEESYTLQPLDGGKPVAGTETSEAVTGNFLLDPDILTVPAESAEHPLVLLD